MAEHLRVDSQKIALHPHWVARWHAGRNDWQTAKSIYPLQVEISASGHCNHRCTFCALDFVGYRPVNLNQGVLGKTLEAMARGGVKSVMFGGEGEPGLNPELAEIIAFAKELGLDVALTTNGSGLAESFLEKCLKDICWIKVSIDAGQKETYQKIHRPKNHDDWDRLFANLALAGQLKRKNNHGCRIGAQMLLLPEARDNSGETIPGNIAEAIVLAEALKKIGLDYFIIKPYSHQPLSITKAYEQVAYDDYSDLEKTLKSVADDNFEIIFRSQSMKKYSAERRYHRCLAIPFAWAYIMADGSVYGCSVYLADEKFYLGNINEQPFEEIWEGERRRRQWEFMKDFDPSNCRKNCIMDRVNEHLWETANPPYNVNFI